MPKNPWANKKKEGKSDADRVREKYGKKDESWASEESKAEGSNNKKKNSKPKQGGGSGGGVECV